MSGRYCEENKLRSKTTLPYIRQKNISFLSITLDFVNLLLDFGFLYFLIEKTYVDTQYSMFIHTYLKLGLKPCI